MGFVLALVLAANAGAPPVPLPEPLHREWEQVRGQVQRTVLSSSENDTTLFARLRETAAVADEDIESTLVQPILGECLTPLDDFSTHCTEFDARDLAAAAPEARKRLQSRLLVLEPVLDSTPWGSELQLLPYDFKRHVFPTRVTVKICAGTIGQYCIVPVDASASDAPSLSVKFDLPVQDERIARSLAARDRAKLELLFVPTGRVSPRAYRKGRRIEDWIEGRLIALRLSIPIPAPASTSAEGEVGDGEATEEQLLADYFFR